MIDFSEYLSFLRSNSLDDFAEYVSPKLDKFFSELRNSDFSKWQKACASLPEIVPDKIILSESAICAELENGLCDEQILQLRENFKILHPWRKGPFNFFSVYIDTEWRSDWKWDRLKNSIASLKGRRVLDVGCGNGYHCFRMAGEGAKAVVGIDPFLLYVMQFQAINKYIRCENTTVLPLGIDDLPTDISTFDTIFSMGVLYHRKDPIGHLNYLKSLLVSGGELVLETIVVPEEFGDLLEPKGRYAKMRNVWKIPSPKTAAKWLAQAGFSDVKIVDVSVTSLDEQRSTDWMSFESLADFLDKDDRNLTVEGFPAPWRAILVAKK